jgi:ion channel POLLUX/CASTOR
MADRGDRREKIGLGNRIRYFINNLLIRNPAWQMLALIVISAVIIVSGMLLVRDLTPDSFWWSFTRLLDQGTFIEDNQYEPQVATVGVMVTIGGIMVLSLLIGIFSSKITEQLDALKRGRSPVLEKDHYIVCGSGDRLFEVTRELLKAREEDSIQGKVVIFSESSREEVEDLILQRLGRKSVKRVICRSGNTTDVDSLQLPCFQRCAGFVIVGDDDGRILKTLVAINSIRGETHPTGVCELRNRGRHRIADMAYSGIHWLPVREIVMRLIVQVCRQPGLSAVYNEILSFSGNEFYITWPREMMGASFVQAVHRIRGGVAAGIIKAGRMRLNPEPDTLLDEGDGLIVLAENSRSFSFTEEQSDLPLVERSGGDTCRKPLRMLVFSGSSRKFSFMLGLLDAYSMDGAEILVAGSIPQEEGEELTGEVECGGCRISYVTTDRTDPDCIEDIHPENYDSIMVISGKDRGMTDEDADSQCIVTLLIIRNIADRIGKGWNSTVVAEIRNPRNRRLATAAGIDDFVISNEVCSMIMAQLVLEPQLGKLYEEIFDPRGCEIQLRCPDLYSASDYRELIEEGLRRGEVVLGWLTGKGTDARVHLNPERDESFPAMEDARIVVIAER